MFESIIGFFRKLRKTETKETSSKNTAKERLHLVLMQDRANVSADFLELMKQEIIEVIKKYIEVEEEAIDVRLTNEIKEDGTTGAPSLYANIPIVNIRNDMKKEAEKGNDLEKSEREEKVEDKKEEVKENDKKDKEEKQKINEEDSNKNLEEEDTKKEEPVNEEKSEDKSKGKNETEEASDDSQDEENKK